MEWSWSWLAKYRFKSKISLFIKIKLKSIFSVHHVQGVKFCSRLRLNFSHLNKHKFRHVFKDGTNCMCNCVSVTETTLHFLLQFQHYQTLRSELFNSIYNLEPNIRKLSNDKLLHLLSYGSKLYSFEINREIIKLTIKFLKLSKRFERTSSLTSISPAPLTSA